MDIESFLYWPCRILRTYSAEFPSLKRKQPMIYSNNDQIKRTHSAEYPRHYLSIEPPKKYFKLSKRRIITQNDIVSEEMSLLVYGYIREQCICNELTLDIVEIIKLIVSKCPILERFNNNGQILWCASKNNRKIEHYPHNEQMCDRLYLKIECFAGADGYKEGIRWLSIKYAHSGCINEFGVTNKSDKIYAAEQMFPELRGLEQSKEHKICFQEHSSSVISIKLDCDRRQVTFYKNYSRRICTKQIDSYDAYWFFVCFCLCKKSQVCFEIVPTDYVKVKQMEFEIAHQHCYCNKCAQIHQPQSEDNPYEHQTFALFEEDRDEQYELLYDQSDDDDQD